jgi:hypothetical protein
MFFCALAATLHCLHLFNEKDLFLAHATEYALIHAGQVKMLMG